MVKVKKNKPKKKHLSELKKNDTKKKVLNPFEIHVNRQKYNVIGRKLKTEKGLPGVSRSKAMKKRKATILQEYKIKDKANQFFDRRIGEKNRAMTAEDRIIARFTKERMKRHKKNIFNLGDDEVLTHHGQTLSEIERFDNPASDDEDEDNRGKLEAEFVEDAHFGGGILKKVDGEKSSRKDLIEQLIAESKKRKAEKQRTREQTLELTEKLDTEWKDLLPIVSASKKKDSDQVEDSKPDSYDTVMRQLKFEARGKPSDPLKSEETLAKEKQERLEKLEAERLKRMSGFSDETVSAPKHRSADDLDDGFEIESDLEEAEGQQEGEQKNKEKTELEAESDNSLADDVEEEESSEGEDKTEDEEGKQESEDEEEGKEKSAEEEEEEEEDNLSDLKYVSGSESELEISTEVLKSDNKKNAAQENIETNVVVEKKIPHSVLDDNQKKKFIEDVKKKFPNVSQVPAQYEDLQKVLSSYDAKYQGVIVEHMMRSNHSGLNENNKQKLETLFAYLLQYLHDAPAPTSDPKKSKHCFILLNSLAPHLYDLAHLNPINAWRCVIEVLKEKQQQYRKHSRRYPGLDTLVFLKIVSLLFPTSDFRHPVVTPALVFMCQMLTRCRVRTKRDIASGLFLVALLLEYTALSKRFSPAAFNFLRGVVYSSIPKSSSSPLLPPIPPFKKNGDLASLLVLTDQKDPILLPARSMLLIDLAEDVPIDDGFRIRALCNAVAMLKEFHQNLDVLPACAEIFKPVLNLLNTLELDNSYPSELKEDIQQLITMNNKVQEKKLQFLVVEKRRAKALRLYEPHFEKVFDGKRKKPMSRDKQEHEKLVHKYKREEKAALREIRRDSSFIAKLKWKDTLKSDMERNQKVKEIFGAASAQQGELRQLKRKK